MKAVRTLKSQAGFSLIELMTVVAIIGILATVAIPNFTKFQAKARASESRAQLAALFTAQKAFNAEWNDYISDLSAAGYRPNGTLRYVVGFGAAHVPPAAVYPTPPNPYVAANIATDVTCAIAASGCVNGAVDNGGALLGAAAVAGGAAMSNTAFEGRAAGFVGGLVTDVWSIDQNKLVLNSTPGGY